MSLFERASDEIVSLHRFFVDWFDAATADGADFGRFERAMGAGMQMIPPGGDLLGRDAILAHVRSCRATFRGDFAIEIAEIAGVWETDAAILVTYVERQTRQGVRTARRATALFTASSSAPSGVEWRHLHETWMQPAGN